MEGGYVVLWCCEYYCVSLVVVLYKVEQVVSILYWKLNRGFIVRVFGRDRGVFGVFGRVVY